MEERSCEDTAKRQLSASQGERFLNDANFIDRHLDLGLLAPEQQRSKFLLFKSPNLWYFVMACLMINGTFSERISPCPRLVLVILLSASISLTFHCPNIHNATL